MDLCILTHIPQGRRGQTLAAFVGKVMDTFKYRVYVVNANFTIEYIALVRLKT